MGDVWLARVAIILLGLVALAVAVGGTILAVDGREIPPFLAGIGTSAATTIGMVVLVLARPPNGGGNAPPPR